MWETTADPATLRERADQCLNLARKAPSWVDTEVLRGIAGDYLRLAERLELEAKKRVAAPPALAGGFFRPNPLAFLGRIAQRAASSFSGPFQRLGARARRGLACHSFGCSTARPCD